MLRWGMMLILSGGRRRGVMLHMLGILIPLLRIVLRIRWHRRPHLWSVVWVAWLWPHVRWHRRIRHIVSSMTTRHGHLPIRHARGVIHVFGGCGSGCLNVWTTWLVGRSDR